jgi:hypothetical protein
MRSWAMSLCRTIIIMSKKKLIIETMVEDDALELIQPHVSNKPMLILLCTRCCKITMLPECKLPSMTRCGHCGRTFTISEGGVHVPRPAADTYLVPNVVSLIHRP